MADKKPDPGKSSASEKAEEKFIEASEMTMHEMRDAMATMMDASTKMMQAFIDMRLSYLKVMRAGLEDPQATIDMMVKNARGMAEATKNMGRKED